MSLIIVELKTFAFEDLNYGRVKVNIFFGVSIVIMSVDFDEKLVFGWGQVVNLYLVQRGITNEGNILREQ